MLVVKIAPLWKVAALAALPISLCAPSWKIICPPTTPVEPEAIDSFSTLLPASVNALPAGMERSVPVAPERVSVCGGATEEALRVALTPFVSRSAAMVCVGTLVIIGAGVESPVVDFGTGASPVLVGDLLVLNRDQDLGSELLALDKRTGKTVWRTDRSEFRRGFATPFVWRHDGLEEVVVPGSLWTTFCVGFRPVAS